MDPSLVPMVAVVGVVVLAGVAVATFVGVRRRAETMGAASTQHGLVVAASSPVEGEEATALALGLQLAADRGDAWNTLSLEGADREAAASVLSSVWRVDDAGRWREVMQSLVDGAYGAGRASDEEEAALAAMLEQHGVLEPGAPRAIAAYDWGRAINVARWGVAAGLASPEDAMSFVRAAAERAHSTFDSWASFSAAYLLGRLCSYGRGEAWGSSHEQLAAQRAWLLRDPESPWTRLSWQGASSR